MVMGTLNVTKYPSSINYRIPIRVNKKYRYAIHYNEVMACSLKLRGNYM